MCRSDRHHSMLLKLCALAWLLLLTSVGARVGVHLSHAFCVHGTVPTANAATSDAPRMGVVHGVDAHAHAFNADGSSGNDNHSDDQSDADYTAIMPALVHVVPHVARSGAPMSRPSSLRPAPLADLLRPPRVA